MSINRGLSRGFRIVDAAIEALGIGWIFRFIVLPPLVGRFAVITRPGI